jgi:hypothetical protein
MTPDPRTEIAKVIWHRFAPTHHIGWDDETHQAEYLFTVDGISTGLLFNLLLSRINFDGMSPGSITLAELHRAIEGALWPVAANQS